MTKKDSKRKRDSEIKKDRKKRQNKFQYMGTSKRALQVGLMVEKYFDEYGTKKGSSKYIADKLGISTGRVNEAEYYYQMLKERNLLDRAVSENWTTEEIRSNLVAWDTAMKIVEEEDRKNEEEMREKQELERLMEKLDLTVKKAADEVIKTQKRRRW